MHIYVFGSLCRGEVAPDSDIDLLAIVDATDPRFDPNIFSIYSYQRLRELWQEGNPFAWHLALESRLVFSSDGSDYIQELGMPRSYTRSLQDCKKFYDLFQEARNSLVANAQTPVFDLSIIFLSIRNIATCFSLGFDNRADFSRHSALSLGALRIPVKPPVYDVLVRARMLCTRGYGDYLTGAEISAVAAELSNIDSWMQKLVQQARVHERV